MTEADAEGRWPPVIAETTRSVAKGELVESRHGGHVAVVGPRDVGAVGAADRVTFARSAVKPFQAVAALDLVGRDLPDELVAVGWASHRAEPAHLDAVRQLLDLAGRTPADLTTPSRPELGDDVADARLRHNCSGKHALFALAGRAVGVSGAQLLDPAGPVQQRVLAELAAVMGDPAAVGVDGCGAPAVAVPLVRLAGAFAGLAQARGLAARVVAAGTAHPLMVGGTGRLESALLTAGVVAKPGAEGVFAAGWRDLGGRAWGVALKAEDGASRAASVALYGLLVAARVVPGSVWDPPPVLGGDGGDGRAGAVRAATAVVELGDRLADAGAGRDG